MSFRKSAFEFHSFSLNIFPRNKYTVQYGSLNLLFLLNTLFMQYDSPAADRQLTDDSLVADRQQTDDSLVADRNNR